MDFAGNADPLSRDGLDRTATQLGTGAAEIWTVLSVETAGCGFLRDRRPRILFERHVFHRETGGLFDLTNPSVSQPKPGGYLGGAAEYGRLAEAVRLDRTAALRSASWGIGQVMGFNAARAGFADAEAMVAAMVGGEDAQLAGAATFMRAEGLHVALAGHDWTTFARGYNGPDFAKNQYDAKLAAAYASFSTGLLPDLDVRRAQVLFMYLGVDLGRIDGVAGIRTRSAVMQFRQKEGLALSEAVDAPLLTALAARVQQTIV